VRLIEIRGLIVAKLKKIMMGSETRFLFECPGCGCSHGVTSSWLFNNDYDKPTFSPSILVRGCDFIPKGKANLDAWIYSGGENVIDFETVETVCHSFVKDGFIQFLSDCTHSLAGKTAELPDL
jgi:hypothetical protein